MRQHANPVCLNLEPLRILFDQRLARRLPRVCYLTTIPDYSYLSKMPRTAQGNPNERTRREATSAHLWRTWHEHV